MNHKSKISQLSLGSRTVIALVAILSFLVLTSFQNCSDVDFATDNAETAGRNMDELGEELKETLTACEEAARNGTLKSKKIAVTFENPEEDADVFGACKWERKDNEGPRNGRIRARVEQYKSVAIPQGSKVCDMAFSAQNQKFKYDDHFFLTFNGVVIASDAKWAVKKFASIGSQARDRDLHIFKWRDIRNLDHPNSVNDASFKDDYCLGTSCQWPRTETTGPISFVLSQLQMAELGLLGSDGNHEIGLTVTGDDDTSIDCEHSPLTIRIEVQYM